MKKIEAYIQHQYLPRVVSALEGMPEFPGFTVIEVLGHGAGPETEDNYFHTEQNLAVHRRTLVQVVTIDRLADEVINRIRNCVHPGELGDGIITVSPVEAAISIRTGQAISPSEKPA